ncbi:hypothetical protein AALA00_11220 [Lachnospiraceae bacterium 46-15]
MNKGKKWMAVFTLILAAVCAAAAWKIGWQRNTVQKPGTGKEAPEPGGKVNEEIEETVNEEIEETEAARIPASGVIYRFSEDTGNYVMFEAENDTAYYLHGIEEGEIYGEDGRQITESELDTGDQVNIMTDGVVLESYPAQYARIFRVEVTKKADEEEREACIQKYKELAAGFYSEPDPSEKPIMQVSYTGDEMVSTVWLTQGGYHWKWMNADGQMQSEIADAPFITEWREIEEIKFPESVTEIELLPGKEAEEITVSRWRADKENDTDEEGENVNVEKRGDRWYLTGVQKGYYYLFHVRWGESYVEYGFKSV